MDVHMSDAEKLAMAKIVRAALNGDVGAIASLLEVCDTTRVCVAKAFIAGSTETRFAPLAAGLMRDVGIRNDEAVCGRCDRGRAMVPHCPEDKCPYRLTVVPDLQGDK